MEIPKLPKGLRVNPRIVLALALLLLSLFAAIGINVSANKSIKVWAARADIAPGSTISSSDIEIARVYLPNNSKLYLSPKVKILGSSATRKISQGELIPAAALIDQSGGFITRSVPIHVAKNDLRLDLSRGALVDIYALPARDLNAKDATKEIAHGIYVENVDNHSRDLGGEIGILIRLNEKDVLDFLANSANMKLVVVRSAI